MTRASQAQVAASRAAGASLTEKILRKAADHHRAGRQRDAERQYRRILESRPDHPEAHYKLGILANEGGRTDLAVPHLAAALKADPDQPRYWLSLATALLGSGRVPDARAVLQRFTERGFSDPQTAATKTAIVANLFSDAHRHYSEDRLAEAEALIDIIVLLDSGHAEAIHIAGNIAVRTHRFELAADLINIAISLDEGVAGYHANLGNVFCKQERYEDAGACLQHSLTLDPTNAIAHSNLGVVYHKLGYLPAAIASIERAIELDPAYPRAYSNLAVVLKEVGRLDEAVTCYDAALRLDPTFAMAHSNRLFAKMYAAGISPAEQLADAKLFGSLIADPLRRNRPFRNDRDPERRLRIGVVSADFREHAVNYFFEPALRRLDRAALELVAFSNNANDDAATERLRLAFDAWHDIAGLEDEAAADLIEAEAIDILVDLSGHTSGNRLLVLARKPAPIQVGWIGYPGTTGMAAMDYRFTDLYAEPPGRGDDLSVEALWRLPGVASCYQSNPDSPDVAAEAPHSANGYVTFGCFNRFTKVSDDALAAWAEILARVPDARLLLEIANIDAPEMRADVEARLTRLGLPLDRVILEPRTPQNRYVLYNRVDIGLDPFPYNGGTTSLDSLWMGVPFVALEGAHFVARMGHSILNHAGLAALSGRTREDYVALACRLADDHAWRDGIRAGLRARFAASPLMDNQRLADDVRDAWRAMWRLWVERAGEAPSR
ncbi:tetratricopeptide repeat protein [Methylobacterium nigriterrae]|uniref:tetratricopeptide repeat protein n=1 Tax=Methylobacterium nigriterrae TaxID=3127512 RepID=UPI0030139C19